MNTINHYTKKQIVFFTFVIFLFAFKSGLSQIQDKNSIYATSVSKIRVKNYHAFLKTKLLVVINERTMSGQALMDSFNKYWKLTPFKFIEEDEINKYLGRRNIQ